MDHARAGREAVMDMDRSARPFLSIYVVWHPSCTEGPRLSDLLHRHFRRDLFTNVAGGAGIDVLRRHVPPAGGLAPLGIDPEDADAIAIVVLLDAAIADSDDYLDYVGTLMAKASGSGLAMLVFPVAVDARGLEASERLGTRQALRWDLWGAMAEGPRSRRLLAALTHQFCRMLRHRLARLEHPGLGAEALEAFLRPVRIFLSHSKHDPAGARIARKVRAELQGDGDLATFFDVLDIPSGLPFDDVLLHFVRSSAMLVIHTDSYGSRAWCRREILEAKRHDVPIVVANCISDCEERGFPYMANVPVVRLEPRRSLDAARMSIVVARLLDEVLRDLLWRCRVAALGVTDPGTRFLPRQPELVSLVSAVSTGTGATGLTIVYPDPPLGVEETALFESVSSGIALRSFMEWRGAAT